VKSKATIWVEPGEEFYTTPLGDPTLSAFLHRHGINPANAQAYLDGNKWRWFSEKSKVIVDE